MRYRLKTEEELVAEGWYRDPRKDYEILYGPPGSNLGLNDRMRDAPVCSRIISDCLRNTFANGAIAGGSRKWYWHKSMFKEAE